MRFNNLERPDPGVFGGENSPVTYVVVSRERSKYEGWEEAYRFHGIRHCSTTSPFWGGRGGNFISHPKITQSAFLIAIITIIKHDIRVVGFEINWHGHIDERQWFGCEGTRADRVEGSRSGIGRR